MGMRDIEVRGGRMMSGAPSRPTPPLLSHTSGVVRGLLSLLLPSPPPRPPLNHTIAKPKPRPGKGGATTC